MAKAANEGDALTISARTNSYRQSTKDAAICGQPKQNQFPRVKGPGRGADDPSPSSAKVKERAEL
jgi:hypothetical protein